MRRYSILRCHHPRLFVASALARLSSPKNTYKLSYAIAGPAGYQYKPCDPRSKWSEAEDTVFFKHLEDRAKLCTKLADLWRKIAQELPNKTAEQVRHGRGMPTG